jgi:hypothetical protein
MFEFLGMFLQMLAIQTIAEATNQAAPASPSPPLSPALANDMIRAQAQITNDHLRTINDISQMYQRTQAEMMAQQNASAQRFMCALSGTPYVEVIKTW